MTLPIDHIPGAPGDAGRAHGRILRDLGFFEDAFLGAYLGRFVVTNRVTREDLPVQAGRWLDGLPPHFREEIDGMALGAGVRTLTAATFLYADIARATTAESRAFDAVRDAEPEPGLHDLPGPLCSAMLARLDGVSWVARNCDWLYATLMRGTAAVVHETPGRIPTLAVGIRGDIDIDTGMNAAGLWLHLHTLLAMDDPPRDRTTISWLFWAREALETCATLDELERFIESTGRDRGVIAVALEGRTGAGALFECTKSDHTRHDFDPAAPRPLVATNHPQAKPIDAAREAKARPGSTVGRYCALRRIARDHPPEHGPDDLIDVLADAEVEMTEPEHLRTIYSAVARPERGEIWFAAGGADGRPAASLGRWERVGWRF